LVLDAATGGKMDHILRGIHQFNNSVFSSQEELFAKLSHGQQPQVLFITCSDSRVNPNLVTQSDPGELFIVRNIGNIVPNYTLAGSAEAGAIEYAVDVLKVTDIVVCGHSHCGAVKALLGFSGNLETLPAVKAWLIHAAAVKRTVLETYQKLSEDEVINIGIQENVLFQLENLRTHPSVASKLARNELKLHGWVYKFESGQIFTFDCERQEFVNASTIDELTPMQEQRGLKLEAI
jgi:carbonic anhydrase